MTSSNSWVPPGGFFVTTFMSQTGSIAVSGLPVLLNRGSFILFLLWDYILHRCNRKELLMTVTELIAIADAAIIGFKKPNSPIKKFRYVGTEPSEKKGYRMPAATGIKAVL